MKARLTELKDMALIVEMLQAISDYIPEINTHERIWNEFTNQKNLFAYSFFIGDEIVGYGSYIIETKIRGGKASHIEDIVVNKKYRGKGIGKKIIEHLVVDSKFKGCYKASLSCSEKNIKFYENCGFYNTGFTMNKKL